MASWDYAASWEYPCINKIKGMRYKSKISFKVRTTTANAKSVLSVLGACVKSGDEIEFVCEGPDEKEALEAMVGIVEAGLGE